MTGSRRHMSQEVKNVISLKASAIGSRCIQASWAAEASKVKRRDLQDQRRPSLSPVWSERGKNWWWSLGLMLTLNTDVSLKPFSFCRGDCGFGARRPESEPWLCHWLAEQPWASDLTSQEPSVLTSKVRVNSNYIFSCLIICLPPTGL